MSARRDDLTTPGKPRPVEKPTAEFVETLPVIIHQRQHPKGSSGLWNEGMKIHHNDSTMQSMQASYKITQISIIEISLARQTNNEKPAHPNSIFEQRRRYREQFVIVNRFAYRVTQTFRNSFYSDAHAFGDLFSQRHQTF